MKLVPNWHAVLTRAWSVRLMVLAFVLTMLEVMLPLLDGYLPIPPLTFATLSGLATAGAFVARFDAQKTASGGKRDEEQMGELLQQLRAASSIV